MSYEFPTNITPVNPNDVLSRVNFPPRGAEVNLAVSGGPDSLALVVLAVCAGLKPTIYHVDHGIRPDSFEDFETVDQVCRKYKLECYYLSVNVEHGPNLEARARQARRSVLPETYMTGHTADDQAETVLMALMRGSGVWGLSAIADNEFHPMLNVRRSETWGICEWAGLTPILDPSNLSAVHRRNRIRHELIPLMNDICGSDIVDQLTRVASHQAEIADMLDCQVEDVDLADAKIVRKLPKPAFVAAMRRFWRQSTGAEDTPTSAGFDRIRDVAEGLSPRRDVQSGWVIARTNGRLRFERKVKL